jgi:hypothetical protein
VVIWFFDHFLLSGTGRSPVRYKILSRFLAEHALWPDTNTFSTLLITSRRVLMKTCNLMTIAGNHHFHAKPKTLAL